METPEELIKKILPKAYQDKDAETIKYASEMMEQWDKIKKELNGEKDNK